MQIDRPIALAIMGAPGSGKTEVAEALVELIRNRELLSTPVHVVDNEEGDILALERPIGEAGNYDAHLAIAFDQLKREQAVRVLNESVVTVGTVIERMAHAAVKQESIGRGIKSPENDQRMMREMHTNMVLSFLMVDSFLYTFGFYLPLPDSGIIMPDGHEHDKLYSRRLDGAMRKVYESFGVPVIGVEGGTAEEKAEKMYDFIVEGWTRLQKRAEGQQGERDEPSDGQAGSSEGEAAEGSTPIVH